MSVDSALRASLRAQAREFVGYVLAHARAVTDIGVDSYGHHLPLAGLIQDALAYPLFSGGNIGFRRRRLQALLADPAYDPWSTMDED
jgi:hypothetical protein